MNVYGDGRKHKDNSFRTRQARDKEVKQLRQEGWIVKVGMYHDIEGSGEIYYYEAQKERQLVR